jgi:hypothetical protein
MKHLVALICACAFAAFSPRAAAQALQFAPQIKFDDGSAESSLQVDVPPVAPDWASVFLDDDYAGREICSMLVRATACTPGRTLTVGLYPSNLVIDPTGHPGLSNPRSQTSAALPSALTSGRNSCFRRSACRPRLPSMRSCSGTSLRRT